MGKYKTNYANGWVNFSIHQFLQEMREEKIRIPHGMVWTIISCLDSCPDVHSLVTQSRHLQFREEDYKPLGRTIAIKTKTLLQAEYQERIFFGFDEVWFMSERSLNRLLYLDQLFHNFSPHSGEAIEIFWRSNPILLSPNGLDERENDRIQTFMEYFDISGGLGDGIGMNYRIRESQRFLITYLLKIYNLIQPSIEDS